MKEPRLILNKLGLSNSEIAVYLAMVKGTRSAQEIIKSTRLKRPTVYYALGCLEKRGLVGKPHTEGEKRFTLEPLSRLKIMAEERVSETNRLADEINELIPSFEVKELSDKKPAVSFFEGVEAVKNVLMESLYCKGKHIDNIFPDSNFFWQLDNREFVEHYVEERARRNITTRNLWEKGIEESSFDKSFFKKFPPTFKESRVLLKIMQGKFSTSICLYDDKTLYVSSIKNCHAVLIKSKEHYDTMQALFNGLWSVSKPHDK
jgi:sugar-specific transcriptional regulator TrmB